MEVQLYVGKIRNLPMDQVFRRRIGFALTTVFSAIERNLKRRADIERNLKRRALVALTNAVAAHNAAAEAQSGAGTCIHTLPQGVAAMAALGGGYRATVVASAQDLARINVRQPFKLNNVALKYIRDRSMASQRVKLRLAVSGQSAALTGACTAQNGWTIRGDWQVETLLGQKLCFLTDVSTGDVTRLARDANGELVLTESVSAVLTPNGEVADPHCELRWLQEEGIVNVLLGEKLLRFQGLIGFTY